MCTVRTHGSLDTRESAFQTASRSVQPFLQSYGRNQQTDRETTLRRDMCSNSLHLEPLAVLAMRLKVLLPLDFVRRQIAMHN